MIAAVLLHLLILLVIREENVIPESPFAAAGPDAGDRRASAGGSGLEMVQLRVEQTPAEEPMPEPVPDPDLIEEVEVEPEPDPTPEPAPTAPATQPGTGGAGSGGLAGEAVGQGREDGDGRGGGGTEAEGTPTGLIAPVPRGMILPPSDRPGSVRGREVTVWVFVNAQGRVVPDSTRLDPPTPDRRYNERLRRSASEWIFEPARRAGAAVASWYPFEIFL